MNPMHTGAANQVLGTHQVTKILLLTTQICLVAPHVAMNPRILEMILPQVGRAFQVSLNLTLTKKMYLTDLEMCCQSLEMESLVSCLTPK
jgi:hypothetical protein